MSPRTLVHSATVSVHVTTVLYEYNRRLRCTVELLSLHLPLSVECENFRHVNSVIVQPDLAMADLAALGYGLGVTFVVLFGLFATAYAIWRQVKHGQDTPEFFLTARKSVKTFTIGW